MIKPATRNVMIFSALLLIAFVCSVVFGEAEGNTDPAAEGSTAANTANKSSSLSASQTAVAAPVFSADSGFYKNDFQLTIDCDPGCTVYYTVDGSDPDPAHPAEPAAAEPATAKPLAADPATANPASDRQKTAAVSAGQLTSADPNVNPGTLRYAGSIAIDDASHHANIYSMNTDTSTGFYADLIRRTTGFGSPGYEAPPEPIDKCTIIRAVAVDEAGTASPEAFGSWFVSKSIDDFVPCNLISIMTDPDNLFDHKKGIYVTGDRFKNYLAKGENRWTKWDANYYMSGPDSERSGRFQLFDTTGQEVSARLCRLRIHGNVTRAYNQKSFSVFFGNEADSSDQSGDDTSPVTAPSESDASAASAAVHLTTASTLGADIFGTGYDPAELLLSNGGQNMTTKFNNVGIAQAMGDDPIQRHYEPTVLFLDGEYWGFYWITERYDADWIAHYFRVDPDDVVAVKFDTGVDYAIRSPNPLIREQEKKIYEETEQFALENDLSDPENYAKAGEYLDLDNFIDYYAAETYLANADWPTRNKEYWRTWNSDGKTACADGRWRTLLFDLDLSLDLEFNGLERALAKDDLFAALWENETFRQKYQDRVFYYADEVFAPDKMAALIDEYCDTYEPALAKSWNRFFKDRPNFAKGLRGEMDQRLEFFKKRRSVVEGWFR